MEAKKQSKCEVLVDVWDKKLKVLLAFMVSVFLPALAMLPSLLWEGRSIQDLNYCKSDSSDNCFLSKWPLT